MGHVCLRLFLWVCFLGDLCVVAVVRRCLIFVLVVRCLSVSSFVFFTLVVVLLCVLCPLATPSPASNPRESDNGCQVLGLRGWIGTTIGSSRKCHPQVEPHEGRLFANRFSEFGFATLKSDNDFPKGLFWSASSRLPPPRPHVQDRFPHLSASARLLFMASHSLRADRQASQRRAFRRLSLGVTSSPSCAITTLGQHFEHLNSQTCTRAQLHTSYKINTRGPEDNDARSSATTRTRTTTGAREQTSDALPIRGSDKLIR